MTTKRALHLVDLRLSTHPAVHAPCDHLAVELAVNAICQLPHWQHQIIAIGPTHTRQQARILGLQAARSITHTDTNSAVRDVRCELQTGVDLVHCTSPAACSLAKRALGDATPRALSTASSPAQLTHAGLLDSQDSFALVDTTVLAVGVTNALSWRSMSPLPRCIASLNLPARPKLVVEGMLTKEELGITSDAIVIGLVPQQSGSMQVDRFVQLISLLNRVGVKAVGLVHRSCESLARARSLANLSQDPMPVIIADLPSPALHSLLDMAIAIPPPEWDTEPSEDPWLTRSICQLHAWGVPVLTPSSSCPAVFVDESLVESLCIKSNHPTELFRVTHAVASCRDRLGKLSDCVIADQSSQMPDAASVSFDQLVEDLCLQAVCSSS